MVTSTIEKQDALREIGPPLLAVLSGIAAAPPIDIVLGVEHFKVLLYSNYSGFPTDGKSLSSLN
jgi:hypothetical protein